MKNRKEKSYTYMKKNTRSFGKRLLTAVLTVAVLVSGLAIYGLAITKDTFGDDPKAYFERLYGDVNLDWELNAIDYMMVKRAVSGTYTLADKQAMEAADVNQDGAVNAIDYLIIKRSVFGTFGPLGIITEELKPNFYASLTDEELYALIDEELAADPDPEGQNLLLFGFKRIKRESQGAAVLGSLGFPDDLEDPIYLDVGHATNLYLMILMEVPREHLREAIFQLRRCDEIGGCQIHGDQWSYAE